MLVESEVSRSLCAREKSPFAAIAGVGGAPPLVEGPRSVVGVDVAGVAASFEAAAHATRPEIIQAAVMRTFPIVWSNVLIVITLHVEVGPRAI